MVDPAHSSVPPTTTTEHIHEESDVAIRPLATFLVSLVAGIAVVALVTAGTFRWFYATTNLEQEIIPVIVAPEEPFTAPELQVLPRYDLATFRANEAKILDATEWIDRNHGIVRIPVSRAIDLVAERGFPDWPKMDVVPSAEDVAALHEAAGVTNVAPTTSVTEDSETNDLEPEGSETEGEQ